MSQPAGVTHEVIEAVIAANTQVVTEHPAMASLYQTIGNSVAMAAANTAYAEQQAHDTLPAATSVDVMAKAID